MTVLAVRPRLLWAGSGATSSIALTVDGVPLTYRDPSHIRVKQLIVATNAVSDMVLGVDYSFGVGTLNRIAGNLPSGYVWAIWRESPRAQEIDLVQGGDFASDDVEDLGNISTEQVQELADAVDRAFKLSVFADPAASNELPAPAAGRLLAWNEAADALINVLPADAGIVQLVSAFMESVLAAADAAAVRTLISAAADPILTVSLAAAATPLTVRRTENTTDEREVASYQVGSGAGAKASDRIVGDAANGVVQRRRYIGSTEIERLTTALALINIAWGVGANIRLHPDGYLDIAEIAAPENPSAGVARFSVRNNGETELVWVDSAGILTTLRACDVDDMAELSNRLVTAGIMHLHPGVAKAQGLVGDDGSLLSGSYGIASAGKDSTGVYTVTLSAALSDIIPVPAANAATAVHVTWETVSSTVVRVRLFNSSHAAVDGAFSIAIFGTVA